MSIESLKSSLPDYAKDLKLNLGSLLNETILTDQQKYGCYLACAYAVGQPDVVKAINSEVDGKLSPEAMNAAKAAAAIMGMNNVYYRFLHLSSDKQFSKMPAGLQMNAMANPGVDKADFELFSLAVSALNGCGLCIDSHVKTLVQHDVTAQAIQTSIKLAAVLNAALTARKLS